MRFESILECIVRAVHEFGIDVDLGKVAAPENATKPLIQPSLVTHHDHDCEETMRASELLSELLATLLIAACRFSEEEHPLDLMVALDNVEIDSYALQRQLATYIGCEDEDRAFHARRFAARYGT